MKKAAILLFCMLLVSCVADIGDVQQPKATERNVDVKSMIPGQVRVKVTDRLAESLGDGIATVGDVPNVTFERTFPYAGKFEARTRAEGLHLWYDVKFDESVPLTRAGNDLRNVPGIIFVEYCPAIVLPASETNIVPLDETDVDVSDSLLFDDPYLSKQWHYLNRGNVVKNCVEGCDINIVPAWQNLSVGSPDVIVAVVDGGIDYNHEDLAGNMWHNPEQQGVMQYGYNFITNSYGIVPHAHGTHVAGTIGAVNNNGIGVCGIAGGNAAQGQRGVQLMSCQIFSEAEEKGSAENAIKWACDHGAVICQNSWGYEKIDYVPEYVKAAIDYFNKYAGLDENGNQVGPMDGGVCIFSAGNESLELGSPAMYEGCVAVGAVGGDFTMAYYSNYGNWVDIAAPGGDAKKKNYVISTLPGNQYGEKQGTSMACPHVSGVAALIVSEYGGKGFTREDLIKRLLNTTEDISVYVAKPFGTGLVNAYRALAPYWETLPPAIPLVSATLASSNAVELSFIVPRPVNNVEVAYADIFVSDENDFPTQPAMSVPIGRYICYGDTVSCILDDLDFCTEYNIAIRSADAMHNYGEFFSSVEIETVQNNAPELSLTENDIQIQKYQIVDIPIIVKEPDGHIWNYVPQEGHPAESYSKVDDTTLVVTLNGLHGEVGKYSSEIVVADKYGMSSSVMLYYEILPNHAPRVLKNIENQAISGKNKVIAIALEDYFGDEDGEPLNYACTVSKSGTVSRTISNGILSIEALNYGIVEMTVTATDASGESVSSSFNVLTRDNSSFVDIYPNPLKGDGLYFRTGKETRVAISVYNTSGAVVKSASVEAGPFTPYVLDMKDVPAGMYHVEVTQDGQVYVSNLIRL